ncbi:hypothetical protein [Sinorhizobium medicae]|uniref:hypothetical protein n=1 Tax=Sinorhizobium medicae TaxID=110321 RepID=UPI000462D75D|nr:hypothetical protein [Sinorhizobium medicae]
MNGSDPRFLKAAGDAWLTAATVETASEELRGALIDRALRELRDAYSLPVGAGANRLTYHDRFRRVVAVLCFEGMRARKFRPVAAYGYVRQHILQIGGAIEGNDLHLWRKWLRACVDPTTLHLRDRLSEIYSTDAHLFAVAILMAFAPEFGMSPIKPTN